MATEDVLLIAADYDEAALESTAANKIADDKKKAKGQLKMRLLDKMAEEQERMEREGVKFHGVTLQIDGRQVTFSHDEEIYARIVNPAEFKKWAEQDDSENWFEPEPRIREDLLNGHVRICVEEGRPLPPGVKVHVERKLHRNTRSI